MSLKQTLKHLTPQPLWNAARATLDVFNRLPELPAAYLHPWRRASVRSLAELEDKHRGQRCFIIGNGPSLRQTDLTKLRNEYTFGMNRIYILFPELGFTTTFFLSINDLVIEQCVGDILALPVPKFLSWRSHRFFQPLNLMPSDLPTFLYTTYTGPNFARNARGRLWEGATVTYVALQLAFYMGFEQAILIGVDHTFVTKGQANATVTSQGDDPNHFAPDYFGKGFRWQLPDLGTSERAYCMAKQAFESAGREVIDATVGGKLTIFRKVDYNALF